jgi:hypothetical protein
MAKFVLKNTDNNYLRICEDVESRDFWINNFVDISSYEEISDADYELVQRGIKTFTTYQPLNISLIDTQAVQTSFNEEDIRSELNELIKTLETRIQFAANAPAIWTTNLNVLKAINLNSLTYPITGYNWVDCLMKNDIQVPSSMEL